MHNAKIQLFCADLGSCNSGRVHKRQDITSTGAGIVPAWQGNVNGVIKGDGLVLYLVRAENG